MSLKFRPFPAAILLFALGACAERDTVATTYSGVAFNAIGTAGELNIGTDTAAGTQTGLPFAVNVSDRLDNAVFPDTMEVRMVSVLFDDETGAPSFVVSDLASEGGLGRSDFAGSITLDGKEIALIASPMGNGAAASVSEDGFRYLVSPRQYGTFVKSYNLSSSREGSGSFAPGTQTGQFLVGLETMPDGLVAPEAAFVTYNGSIFGTAQRYEPNGDPASVQIAGVNGTVSLDVDFVTGEVGGSLLPTIFLGSTPINLELDITPTTLVGNGFSTTATAGTFCMGCSSNTRIGGALYGPSGEELAGIIALDVTVDNGGSGFRTVGTAGFIAKND